MAGLDQLEKHELINEETVTGLFNKCGEALSDLRVVQVGVGALPSALFDEVIVHFVECPFAERCDGFPRRTRWSFVNERERRPLTLVWT